MKTVSITGTSGAQGSAIAQAFEAAGYQTKPLRRDDMQPDAKQRLIDKLMGSHCLVLTAPIDHRPSAREAQFAALLDAARAAGVNNIVLNTAAAIPAGLHKPVANNLRVLKEMVLSSGLKAVVVEPTVYLDNLLAPWSLPALQNGVLAYPAPAKAPISWVSHRSLAQYVLAAAESNQYGQTFEVGGAKALTAEELCADLSQALGKPIRYQHIPFEAFAQGLNQAAGAPAGDDIADYYQHLLEEPTALSRVQPSLLAVQPETALEWAKRQTW